MTAPRSTPMPSWRTSSAGRTSPSSSRPSAYYYDAVFDGFGPDNLMAQHRGDRRVHGHHHAPGAEPELHLRPHAAAASGSSSPAILESTNAATSKREHARHRCRPGRHGAVHPRVVHPGRQRHPDSQRGLLGDAGLPRLADHPADRRPGGAPPGAPGRQHPGLRPGQPGRLRDGRGRGLPARPATVVQHPVPWPQPGRSRQRGRTPRAAWPRLYGGETESPLQDLASARRSRWPSTRKR